MDIFHKAVHEDMLNYGSNTGFKWKQREELTEERIYGLNVWDKHSRRVTCKVMGIIEGAYHVEERHRCVIW